MRQKLQDALGTSGTASPEYPVPSSPQLDVTATPEDGTQAADGTHWDFTKNTDFRLLK